MPRPLIKDSVNELINSLIGDMFSMNRMLDRQMSVLSVQFVMPNTVSFLHPKLAHFYPSIADFLSDYQGSRNNLSVYPETPIGNEDYKYPIEVFNKMLEKQIQIEENVSESIVFSHSEGDMMTSITLQEFLLKLKPITEQMLLLCDKMYMYGFDKKNWMDFDHDVEKFIVL